LNAISCVLQRILYAGVQTPRLYSPYTLPHQISEKAISMKRTNDLLTMMFVIVAAHAVAVSSPLRITEVQPSAAEVEVTNISDTTYTLANNFPFTYLADTSQFIASGTEFAAGESKTFNLPGLDASDSDVWLYNSNSFASSAAIETGVKYGPAANVGNTGVAVSAGIWPSTSAFVAGPANSANSLRITSYTFGDPAAWAEGATNLGTFFGTGTAIADPFPAPITKGSLTVELTPFISGMSSPLGLAFPDDGTNRLFAYDQTGTVTLVLNGVVQPTFFLDVSARLAAFQAAYDERGLLGLAFHPNFASNPKVYTYTSEPVSATGVTFEPTQPTTTFDHDDVLAEWTVDSGSPNVVNTATRREILRIHHPAFNHNGGTVRFGADGYLYFTIGDGGTGDDQGNGHLPTGNAQILDNIFGKVIRIDVDGSDSGNGQYGIPPTNPFVGLDGLDEIYAYGFRNPYAFSFDKTTHDLYVGDAGQNKVEEVDIVTRGANAGWHLKEGTFFFDPNGSGAGFVSTLPVSPLPSSVLDPFMEYDHDEGVVVVGGYVYRGSALPSLSGLYITGDFSQGFASPGGRLFSADTNGQISQFHIGTDDRALGLFLKGFGEDQDGELYVCGSKALGPISTTGVIMKIVPAGSGISDWKSYQ
jgi:glucose/arabinose dehydrogenase